MKDTIAVGQVGAVLGNVRENVARCQLVQHQATAVGAALLVLPEAVLSGYVFESRDEALKAAIAIDGPELAQLAATASKLDLVTIIGFLERAGDQLFNSAALLHSNGRIVRYRKCHLPCLGVDRFVDKGDETGPVVVETDVGRIGLAICYDLRFPESARVLALAGADIIVQPSNWPPEARMLAEHFGRVRACENRVYVAIADRGDDEGGIAFMGRSQIVDPTGEIVAEAGRGDALLTAKIDLSTVRDKRIIVKPGEYEVHLFDDRRPELYGAICDTTPWPLRAN